jgi:ribonuclease inhibitor
MKRYTLDLTAIASTEALHGELARVFAFPDYYGGNWDAFDECIADVALPLSLKVVGFESFRFRLKREASLLARCFVDASKRAPLGQFVLEGLP